MRTLDDIFGGEQDDEGPRIWIGLDGFLVFGAGRLRQFGWCCGRLGFNYRYTRFLIAEVTRAAILSKRLFP